MRATLLTLAILLAGCTSSAASDELVVKLDNASSEDKTVSVNVDELGSKRIDHFQLTATAQESATHRVSLPDVETILISVEADGKVVGAKSISPAKCAGNDDPFLIQASSSGTVTILGKQC